MTSNPAELRDEVLAWLEKNRWKGIDPFDGLNAPFARRWVEGDARSSKLAPWIRLAVLQSVKRSPVDLRGMLGVRPQANAMSWAVGALGAIEAARRGERDREELILRSINQMLELAGHDHCLWGYPFAWQARAFYLAPNEPNIVISSLALRALSEAIHWAESSSSGQAHAQVMRWRGHAMRAVVNLCKTFFKDGIFSYVGHERVLVHNANLFGAEAVVLCAGLGIEQAESRVPGAVSAIRKTLQAQEASGRWAYGTLPHHQWSDNFHTAYNLVSLGRVTECLSDGEYSEFKEECSHAIRAGLKYYLDHAFTEEGSARYYDRETWPLETHSAAAALISLRELSRMGWLDQEQASSLASRALEAVVRDNYLGGGAFAYRRWPRHRIKSVFTRWTQAWMYWALECAISLEAKPQV